MAEKFSKRVENTVGKGEIARNEQFLLFLQCFLKACTADTYKPGLVWQRVKALAYMKIVTEELKCVTGRLEHCTKRRKWC